MHTDVRGISSKARKADACCQEGMMIRHRVQDVDNRDQEHMYEYLEARIEVMKRRITELEAENVKLNAELDAVWAESADRFAATA